MTNKKVKEKDWKPRSRSASDAAELSGKVARDEATEDEVAKIVGDAVGLTPERQFGFSAVDYYFLRENRTLEFFAQVKNRPTLTVDAIPVTSMPVAEYLALMHAKMYTCKPGYFIVRYQGGTQDRILYIELGNIDVRGTTLRRIKANHHGKPAAPVIDVPVAHMSDIRGLIEEYRTK